MKSKIFDFFKCIFTVYNEWLHFKLPEVVQRLNVNIIQTKNFRLYKDTKNNKIIYSFGLKQFHCLAKIKWKRSFSILVNFGIQFFNSRGSISFVFIFINIYKIFHVPQTPPPPQIYNSNVLWLLKNIYCRRENAIQKNCPKIAPDL